MERSNIREQVNGDEKLKSLIGTKTEKNVLLSFAGESQARNRYTRISKNLLYRKVYILLIQ